MKYRKEFNQNHLINCPSKIAIVGGGRWARVIINTLCDFIPRNTKVLIYTPHNNEGMSKWVKEQKYTQKITVKSDWLNFGKEKIEAMIVANSPRDHEAAIEKGLNALVPVLVEKPLTLSYKSSKRLIELAEKNNIFFATAHVFLFASYLQNFSQLLPDVSKIKSIQFEWIDPEGETRYGEQKQYDASVPVFMDCLPHVLSIIESCVPLSSHKLKKLIFNKGGADLKIEIIAEEIKYDIKLERNGVERRRVLIVQTDETYQLDFSKEPGMITHRNNNNNADPTWNTTQKPLTALLNAFLSSSAGGQLDERLNSNIGLKINEITDEISNLYNASLFSWLEEKFRQSLALDKDLKYALKEILLANGPIPSEEIKLRINNIIKAFNCSDDHSCYKKFTQTDNKLDFISKIGNQHFI